MKGNFKDKKQYKYFAWVAKSKGKKLPGHHHEDVCEHVVSRAEINQS